MSDKQRQISKRSLENLKLGAQTRYQGKVRHNFTILPETAQWLKDTGNASDAIDFLVEAFRDGALSSDNIREWREREQIISNDAYKQMEALKLELDQVRSQLETVKALEENSTELLKKYRSDAFRAAHILKAAFSLPSSNEDAIKTEIKKALELIDNV